MLETEEYRVLTREFLDQQILAKGRDQDLSVIRIETRPREFCLAMGSPLLCTLSRAMDLSARD